MENNTHILFTDKLQLGTGNDYTIEPITKTWHLNCNNFTGTEKECVTEGDKMKIKSNIFFSDRNDFSEQHYINAPYESIFDY